MSPARRRTEIKQVRIPADLAGPVEVALARSVDQIPGPRAMPGASRYEVKWEGTSTELGKAQTERRDLRCCASFLR
jgi:hypothetical protein